MRMGNPAMRRCVNRATKGEMSVETSPSTYGGIAWKSILFTAVTIVSAIAIVLLFNLAINQQSEKLMMGVLIAALCSGIPMLIFSLIIAFAPGTVKVLGILYSICQGALLGITVYFVDLFVPGVAFAAILGTVIVFILTVVLNKLLSVRIKGRVFRAFMVAFMSFFVVELVMMLLSLFNQSEGFFTAYFWIQLVATAFLVVYAAIMLMWDIQMADDIVQMGADKKYEWLVAFSLVTTLVYLYIEILELILRLVALFANKKN